MMEERFGRVPERVYRDRRRRPGEPGLSDYDITIYGIIAMQIGGRGSWYMSQGELARLASSAERTVNQAVRNLRERGHIQTTKGPRGMLAYSIAGTYLGSVRLPSAPELDGIADTYPDGIADTEVVIGDTEVGSIADTVALSIADTDKGEEKRRKEKKKEKKGEEAFGEILSGSNFEGSAPEEGSTLHPELPRKTLYRDAELYRPGDIPQAVWDQPGFEAAYIRWEASPDGAHSIRYDEHIGWTLTPER